MKKCRSCETEKDLSEFGVCSRNKDGRTARCLPCKRTYDTAHYKANQARRRDYIIANRKARVEALQKYLFAYLSSHPCVDCGEDDIIVLEFDHRDRATKLRAVSNLIHDGASLERLKGEIEKCEIRCANCHRRKTAQQFGWNKLEWV